MTAAFAAIRAGLAANITAALSDHWQISAYVLVDPSPPSIDIATAPIDYDQAMRRGLDGLTFTIRAIVPANDDVSMQKLLDDLVAPASGSSLKSAVEADRTLGGIVDDLRVESCSEPRLYGNTEGGVPTYGVEFAVTVLP